MWKTTSLSILPFKGIEDQNSILLSNSAEAINYSVNCLCIKIRMPSKVFR